MIGETMVKQLRDRAESGFVAALIACCRVLPVRVSVRIGERLGAVVGRLDRKRKRIALRNLELAYGPDLSPEERLAIVRGVYRHLGRVLLEDLLLLCRPELRPLSRFIEFDGLDHGRVAIRDHGAAIFVTLHQGHWELLGGAFSEQVTTLHAVMHPIRNPRLNERAVKLRSGLGMVIHDREQAVATLFRNLRRGKSVGLVCDLNQKEGPEFVDFFGVPAATVRTPGVLAVRTGKPVICLSSWSLGEPLRYRGELAPPIVPRADAEPEAEVRRIVSEMNLHLERFVRAHPEQWNWIHRRWRTRPPAAGERLEGQEEGAAP